MAEECITRLIDSSAYRYLMKQRDDFNLLSLFAEAFGEKENAFSCILAFLLDSSQPHGLAALPAKAFLQNISHLPKGIGQLLDLPELEVRSATEWSTDDKRRVDVVLNLTVGGALRAIIGIENKIYAGTVSF